MYIIYKNKPNIYFINIHSIKFEKYFQIFIFCMFLSLFSDLYINDINQNEYEIMKYAFERLQDGDVICILAE
jgi:hypothetical protein